MAPPRFDAVPPCRPRNKTGYRGIRRRENGRFSAEITHGGKRWYMGTFDSPEEAARAYDFAVLSLGADRRLLNWQTTRDVAQAQDLAPQGIRIVSLTEEKENRLAERQLQAEQLSEAAIRRMCEADPSLAAANAAYFAAKDAEVKTSAGPSTSTPEVVNLDSDSSSFENFDTTDDDE